MKREGITLDVSRALKSALPSLDRLSVTRHKYVEGHSIDIKWSGTATTQEVASVALASAEGFSIHDQSSNRIRLWRARS